jgi:Chaperone of endosialidase
MTKMFRFYALAFVALLSPLSALPAQVPQLINYQGRVAVGTVNFDGSGQFKFALVNADGSSTYWSNDGSSTAGSQPAAAVALTVTKGLYSVQLGDAALTNMTAIPASVFANADVRLRVWFNDGTNGFQLLTPDQRIAAVGYAMVAATVPDGSITSAKIADGSIGTTQLATSLSINGTLVGNASTATTAATATTAGSFTGTLLGDVTGTQAATVVSKVGTSTAALVHSAELAANAATTANTPSTIVMRDASGGFTAGTITARRGFSLPTTDGSGTVGVIQQEGTSFIHSYGDKNFFAGLSAGNFTLTGAANTALGFEALVSDTTGDYNVAIGSEALLYNASGHDNTGVGNRALNSNSSGASNTALGSSSLYFNTTGSNNTASGQAALALNTTGSFNTAIGDSSLSSNTTGSYNFGGGISTLYRNTAGNLNTANGWFALYWNTGNNNIALGASAGMNLTSGSYNIDIGNPGVAGESSTIRIGNSDFNNGGTQTSTFIAGISGVTISGGAAVFINSSGQLGTITSSRRFKDDIQTMGASSESLLALRPVTFRYKPEIDSKGIPQWGLIAEEVNAVNPDLVVRDDKGVIQTVRYEQVNAMLLNEFLKDHRRADGRDKEIKSLQDENAAMKKRLAELEAKDKDREAREKVREERLAKLEQFIPAEPKHAPATAALNQGE